MARGDIRVGIVGRRGAAFAAGLRSVAGVRIAAVCEADAERLQRLGDELGADLRFARYAAMLEHVDAVVVATPMQLHAPQAILALDAGKHVLSEVTAAVSLEECWRLADAVQRSGATYMMAENYCYSRECVLVREMARRGLFGEPYFGEGEYLHDVRTLHHTADGQPTWRYYWQVGSRGSTYPTHSLGPVMQWLISNDSSDRIESVVCMGSGVHTDSEHPHDDTTVTLCQLRSGRLAKVRLDMMSNRPHQMAYYSLQGTHGVYEASRFAGERGHVWVGENRPDDHRTWRPIADFDDLLPDDWKSPSEDVRRAGHGGGDYFVARDFVSAVRSGQPPPIDVYAALEWTAAGLCSQVSIQNGGVPIRVPDFRDPSQRPITLDAPPMAP